MAFNPLDEMPGARKALYITQWVVNGAIGVLGIVFAAQHATHQWFTITVAATAFVWSYTGITAQTNTPAGGVPGNPDPAAVVGKKGEDGALEGPVSVLLWLLVVVVAVVLVVWLLRVLLAAG